MVKEIYLDNAASTPVDNNLLKIYTKSIKELYANPSSIHSLGIKSQKALQEARKKIAMILQCPAEEIIFTSGGTESNNLAIKGIAMANKSKGNHIITTKIEHPSSHETCKFLETCGFEVTYLDVNEYGIVNLDELRKAIKKSTILISIIYCNNEIGTIQPIREISKISKIHNIPLHVDACQAPGQAEININSLGVDLMTLNSSKIFSPKGVGGLFKRNNVNIAPLLHGGNQEMSQRAGTENVPAIVTFAKALEIAEEEKAINIKKITELRNYFISQLQEKFNAKLRGHPIQRLPNNITVTIPKTKAESLIIHLSEKGISCSQGAACASRNYNRHVFNAIGISPEEQEQTLRISLSKHITKKDIDQTIKTISNYLKK